MSYESPFIYYLDIAILCRYHLFTKDCLSEKPKYPKTGLKPLLASKKGRGIARLSQAVRTGRHFPAERRPQNKILESLPTGAHILRIIHE
jgi:hypothetical protein